MTSPPKKIARLLVANRSEIAIRVFRTAHELGIRTVAIYSHEDRYALHRFKADEAYLVGKPGEPIRAYLDIDGIIALAKQHDVDAIHPGYGFLSENPEFARACERGGHHLRRPARRTCSNSSATRSPPATSPSKAGVPVLGGSDKPIDGRRRRPASSAEQARLSRSSSRRPQGGGGRGMRVVHKAEDFADAFESAQRESLTAFGSPDVFVEKFIQRAAAHRSAAARRQARQPRPSVRARLLGAAAASEGRRNRPGAESRSRSCASDICEAALAIGRAVNYENAGTVEFLVDADTNKFYFIEVNPRIQVEHTVTEEVTGIDIVRSRRFSSRRARRWPIPRSASASQDDDRDAPASRFSAA